MIARHAYFQKYLAVSTGIQPVSFQYHPLFSASPQLGGSGSHIKHSTTSQVAAHILPVGDPAMLITVNFF